MTRQWEPVTLTSDVVTENPDVAVTLYASAFRHADRIRSLKMGILCLAC